MNLFLSIYLKIILVKKELNKTKGQNLYLNRELIERTNGEKDRKPTREKDRKPTAEKDCKPTEK